MLGGREHKAGEHSGMDVSPAQDLRMHSHQSKGYLKTHLTKPACTWMMWGKWNSKIKQNNSAFVLPFLKL